MITNKHQFKSLNRHTINKADIEWTLQHTFSYSLIALSVLLVGLGITYTMAKQLSK